MPWLVDPSQTPPPSSWLQSPAVALVGLGSGVISIVQAVTAVGKWVSGKASKEDARRRHFVYFSTVCAAVSAIMVPVTWTAIVAADLGTGDPRWICG
jgi:hypothetical protein